VSDERELLRRTAELAADYLESLDERPVFPSTRMEDLAAALGGPLPDGPSRPLAEVGG
jgi:hypothetical protein